MRKAVNKTEAPIRAPIVRLNDMKRDSNVITGKQSGQMCYSLNATNKRIGETNVESKSSLNGSVKDGMLSIPLVRVQTPSCSHLRSRSLSVPSIDANILQHYSHYTSVSKSLSNRVNERLITLSSRHLSLGSPPESSHPNSDNEGFNATHLIGRGHQSPRMSLESNEKQWKVKQLLPTNQMYNNERSVQLIATQKADQFGDNIEEISLFNESNDTFMTQPYIPPKKSANNAFNVSTIKSFDI